MTFWDNKEKICGSEIKQTVDVSSETLSLFITSQRQTCMQFEKIHKNLTAEILTKHFTEE